MISTSKQLNDKASKTPKTDNLPTKPRHNNRPRLYIRRRISHNRISKVHTLPLQQTYILKTLPKPQNPLPSQPLQNNKQPNPTRHPRYFINALVQRPNPEVKRAHLFLLVSIAKCSDLNKYAEEIGLEYVSRPGVVGHPAIIYVFDVVFHPPCCGIVVLVEGPVEVV